MLRILSLLCFFLFGACKSTPSRWDEKPFSSRTGEGDIIAWKTSPGKKDSGTDISLSVDGHPHLVVNGAASFARMTPGEYESKGVPTEAIAAAYFWAANAREEDAQKIYAVRDDSQIIVYSGYAVPGADRDTQWIVMRTIAL